MIAIFFIAPLVLLFLSIVMLVGFSIYDYVSDPYKMKQTMTKLINRLEHSEYLISELRKIKDKMGNCPHIIESVRPIEVFNEANLSILIIGDSQGKPRLFAFDRKNYNISEYFTLIDSNDNFKKQGLKHSISITKLEELIKEASKKNYKVQLENKQIDEIRKHFKKNII